MQSDSSQQPLSPDHQLPASTDPEHPRHKRIRVAVWIALLIFFAIGFFLVLRHHDEAKVATGRRGALGGNVAVTSATAKKGDIGVYVDAIGTVTPVYTSSITSQVNGIVTAGALYGGPAGAARATPLIEIDPRPYQATLLQAQGMLERDQGVLAQAQMDLARYQAAWARNAISEADAGRPGEAGRAGPGHGEERPGHGAVRPDPGGLLPHRGADHRAGGFAAGRSRQRGAGQWDHGAGGDHADPADHGGVYGRGRQSGAGPAADCGSGRS